MKRRTTRSPEETRQFAAEFARRLEPGTVVALTGDLGTGKTAFAKGIAAALGIEEQITSPTYTIVAEYPGPPTFVHMDLYRIEDATEFELLGVEELLGGENITVIEWAERAYEALPADRTVRVSITFGPGNERHFEIEEPGDE